MNRGQTRGTPAARDLAAALATRERDFLRIVEPLEGRVLLSCDPTAQAATSLALSAMQGTAATATLHPTTPCVTADAGWDFAQGRALGNGVLTGTTYLPGQEPRHTMEIAGGGLIPVVALQLGFEVPRAAKGSPTLPPQQGPHFSLLVPAGAHQTGLFAGTVSGRPIAEVVLVTRDDAGREVARWVLRDVAVEQFSPSDSGGDAIRGVDGVGLTVADRVDYRFTEYNADGTVAARTDGRWEVQRPTGGAPALRAFTFPAGTEPEYVLQIGARQFAVEGWSWGVADNGPAGRFQFTVPSSVESPALMVTALAQRRYPEATLVRRDAAGAIAASWKLEDVTVNSFATQAGADGSSLDHLGLEFAVLRSSATGPGGTKTVEYDFDTRRVVSGSAIIRGQTYPAGALPAQTIQFDSPEHIEVNGWSWDAVADRPGIVGQLAVEVRGGLDSPAILLSTLSSTQYRPVILTRRDAQGREVLRMTLDDAAIVSYATGDGVGSAGTPPAEQVLLAFGRVTFAATEYDAVGQATTRTTTYDRARGVTSGGGFTNTTIAAPDAPGHVLEIEGGAADTHVRVEAWHWGESRSGGVPGAVNAFPFAVQTTPGANSAGLLNALTRPTKLLELRLVSRNASGGVYSRWTMKGVTVRAYNVGGAGSGDADGTEQFLFEPESLELEYTPYDANGAALPVRRAGWDFRTGGATTGNALIAGQTFTPQTMPEHTIQFDNNGRTAVAAFSWSVARFGQATAAAGTVDVTLRMGKDSPGFFFAVPRGQRYPTVTIASHDAAGREVGRWVLEDALVVAYDTSSDGTERISLAFDTITQDLEAASSPTSVGTVNARWDMRTGAGGTWKQSGEPASNVGFGRYTFNAGTEPEHLLDTGSGQVEVLSFNWNVQPTGLQPFGIAMRGGLHSPALAMAVTRGTTFNRFELISRDEHGRVIARWTLEDVQVVSYSVGEVSGDGVAAADQVALLPRTVRVRRFEYCDPQPLLIMGTAGDDVIHLRRAGANVEVFVNVPTSGPPTLSVPHLSVASLDVDGGEGDDEIILDFTGGDPLPDAATTLSGAGGADRIVIGGTSAADKIEISNSAATAGGATFAHDGVESFTVPAASRSLVLTGNVRAIAGARGGVFRTGALSIASGAQLDLLDNDLIVDGGDVAAIRVLLRTARNGTPRWTGPGLASTDASASPIKGLALSLASEAGTFAGQPIDAGDVLVKHTYNGDANLDGRINADDYFRIDQNFLAQPEDAQYAQGDFNYDGKINADDYFLIDQSFLGQGASLTDSGGSSPLSASAGAEPDSARRTTRAAARRDQTIFQGRPIPSRRR